MTEEMKAINQARIAMDMVARANGSPMILAMLNLGSEPNLSILPKLGELYEL